MKNKRLRLYGLYCLVFYWSIFLPISGLSSGFFHRIIKRIVCLPKCCYFQISGVEDLYVFKRGTVSLDTNASLATNHAPATISLKTLHVQEGGTFQLSSYSPENRFTIDATNISVSGYTGNIMVTTEFRIGTLMLMFQ